MGRLAGSIQGLREAVKRQEYQLNSGRRSGGIAEIQLPHSTEPGEEDEMLHRVSGEKGDSTFESGLHRAASEASQASHWSCSLGTINASIRELKGVLKTKDKEVIRLIVENEELKNEIQKKGKELKKQKFLLKAEREMFEQYKKDTFNEVKKNKREEESQEINSDKPSKEMTKLKSEVSHFKRLYLENNHTVGRLSKQVSYLEDEKSQLRKKLMQQENASNKFILEMAQRFEVSRKEFYFVSSKRFESLPIPPTNLAVRKLADRNVRLAHDNCMLKLESNALRKDLFDKKIKDYKSNLTTRSAPQKMTQHNRYDFMKLSGTEKTSKLKKVKALGSETSCFTTECTVTERNSSGNIVVDKSDCGQEWDTVEVMRTESAPQLSVPNNSKIDSS